MADIAELIIKIDSDGVTVAGERLHKFSNNSKKAEKATDSLGKQALKLAASVGAITLAYKGLKAILSVTAEFETLRASLTTVTGSTQAADMAFQLIQKTAKNLPFSVQEITQGFIKLKALGLDPSEAALISYSNTASAMGKSLDQMVEAVADATTGEFERLKEFGIKAKTEGDNVTFTFQGVATTVKKSAKEINDYLSAIGTNQFGGAAAKQMDTLNGKVSVLGDAFDNLLYQIGNSGLGGEAKKAIDDLIVLLSDPNTIADAKALASEIVVGFNAVVRVGISAAKVIGEVGDTIGFAMAFVGEALNGNIDGLKAIFEAKVNNTKATLAEIQALNSSTKAQRDNNAAKKEGALIVPITKFREEPLVPLGDPAELAKQLEKLKQDVSNGLESLLPPEEQLANEYAKRLEIVREAERAGVINVEERNAAIQTIEQLHQMELTRIEEKGNKDRERLAQAEMRAKIALARSFTANLSSLMDSGSRKVFELGKVAAIANATLSGYEATVEAYKGGLKISGGNPAVGAAFAAAAAIATGIQINKIKNTSFGGGGSVSGGGGGGGSAAAPINPGAGLNLGGETTTEGQQRQQIVNVTVNGSVMGEDLEEIVVGALKKSNDKDGVHILVEGKRAEVVTPNG